MKHKKDKIKSLAFSGPSKDMAKSTVNGMPALLCDSGHSPGIRMQKFPSFRNGFTTIITSPDKLPERSRINQDYTINKAKIIGKGSQGTVIRAFTRQDKEKTQPFAIKIIDKKWLKEEETDALKDEIEVLQRLDHENIVTYHSTYQDKQKVYLIMEYCPQSLVEDQLDHVAEKDAKEHMLQIFNAMIHYMAKGVVHRDLKPDNIMIGNDGKIRICDFGMATKLKNTLEKLNTDTGTL